MTRIFFAIFYNFNMIIVFNLGVPAVINSVLKNTKSYVTFHILVAEDSEEGLKSYLNCYQFSTQPKVKY